MALFPLGILSAAGAGGGAAPIPDFELIETTILGSAQNSVTFSSLDTYSSLYRHLQVRMTFRTTRSVGDNPLQMRINGDSGSSYGWNIVYGSNTTAAQVGSSSTDTGIYFGNPVPGATQASGIFGSGFVNLLDAYSSTKNKTIMSLVGANSPNGVQLVGGSRFNTASTTSVTIYTSTHDFAIGSRFSIYGIKG